MFVFLRRNQRILMLIIAILTIIAFAWLYNQTNSTPFDIDHVGKIYGQTVRTTDVDRLARAYRVALMLGQVDLVTTLSGSAQDEGEAVTSYIWNTYVIRHQARKLGIVPTNTEIESAIKAVPGLQTDGVFDPQKYRAFLAERMLPMGFAAQDVEEIIKDSLRVKGLQEVITSSVSISPTERDFSLRVFQGVNAETVRFNWEGFYSKTQIEEGTIEKFFEANREHLMTNELRSVHFAKFPLSTEEAALKGRARVDALQVKANLASDFLAELEKGGADFDTLAKSAGAILGETPEFTFSGKLESGTDADHPELPQIAEATFNLSEKSPMSGVLQAGDSFYVVRLTKVVPARKLTLDEARDKILEHLKFEATQRAIESAAQEARVKIVDAMAAGKSFQEASAILQLPVESLTNVIPQSAQGDPLQRRLAMATLLLTEGQVSGFVPFESAPFGGFLIYLQKRLPVDHAELNAKLEEVDAFLLDEARTITFAEWLRHARDAADIRIFQRR